MSGVISAKNVNWILKSTQEQLDQSSDGINFICVSIDSAGGSLVDSLRLASYLAGLDPTRVRTVAFVESEARGDAALMQQKTDEILALLG